MRNYLLICLLVLAFAPQKINAQEDKTAKQADYSQYNLSGSAFNSESVVNAQWMLQEYGRLQTGDSINVTFKTDVNSVCKSKGCWMRLDLEEEEEVMVRFRDYAFFVPKDIEGKEVVVHGKAYITEMSVEDQRHFAEDGGATPEEIQKITQPKKTLSLLADGVLIEP